MRVGQQTTFTEIYAQLKPGALDNKDKHLRGDGARLYTHNALMPHGTSQRAIQERNQKYSDGVQLIHRSIEHEYGLDVANKVMQNLANGGEVRLRDLSAIKRDLDNYSDSRTLHSVQAPSEAYSGGVPKTPNQVIAKLYDGLSTYIRNCEAQGDRADKSGIVKLINDTVGDFYKEYVPQKDTFNSLSLQDRVSFLSIIDAFGVFNETKTKAMDMIGDTSPKPIMSSAFDVSTPGSQYSLQKETFIQSVLDDDLIRSALKAEKTVKPLDKETIAACISRALKLECEAFGRMPNPYEFDNGIGSIGQYDQDRHVLLINPDKVGNLAEMLNVACHENLHGFQHQYGVDVANDPASPHEDQLQARLFELELRNYVNSETAVTTYEHQTLEIPAMDIGKSLRAELRKLQNTL